MATAYVNHNRNTCIAYCEVDGLVFAVAMQSPELALIEMGYEQFHSDWSPIESCDVRNAAQQYLNGPIPYGPEVKSILENIMENVEQAEVKTVKGKGKSGDATVTKKAAAPKKDAAKAEKFFADAKAKKDAKAAKDAPAKKTLKKDAGEAKEPGKRGRKPAEDISGKTIKLLPAAEGKRFNEGSIRSQCFSKIKDGMTVKQYIAATTKLGVEEKAAIACLQKLMDVNQKTPTVALQ